MSQRQDKQSRKTIRALEAAKAQMVAEIRAQQETNTLEIIRLYRWELKRLGVVQKIKFCLQLGWEIKVLFTICLFLLLMVPVVIMVELDTINTKAIQEQSNYEKR